MVLVMTAPANGVVSGRSIKRHGNPSPTLLDAPNALPEPIRQAELVSVATMVTSPPEQETLNVWNIEIHVRQGKEKQSLLQPKGIVNVCKTYVSAQMEQQQQEPLAPNTMQQNVLVVSLGMF